MHFLSVCRIAAADFLSRIPRQMKLFGVIFFGLFLWSTKQPAQLYAFGCDSFGYARQAQLFRERGLIQGLDTKIHDPGARRLIEIAREVDGNSEDWQELVAPLCHHYKEGVGEVVLQYPPGTGFMLAMFGERYSLRGLFSLSMALVTIAVCLPIVLGYQSGASLTSGLLLFGLIAWTVKQPDAFASYSVIASIGLASIASMLLYLQQIAVTPARRQRQLRWFALGACCGMLVAVRLPNIFIVCGVACAVVIENGGLNPDEPRKIWPKVWPFALGFLPVTALLVLVPNFINAGGILQTTYNSADAAPPVVSKDVVYEGFRFYYAAGFSSPVVVVVTVLLAINAGRRLFTNAGHAHSGLFFGALTAFVMSLIFFVTHTIRISYYLLPVCIFALFALYFDFVPAGGPNQRREAVRRMALLVASLAALSIAMGAYTRPPKIELQAPAQVLDSEAVLWSDLTSGTAYYYSGKYSSKIAYARECVQNNMIVALAKRGVNQFFVQDSPLMASLIDRLKLSANLESGGELIADRSYAVYLLNPSANPDLALKGCDPGAGE